MRSKHVARSSADFFASSEVPGALRDWAERQARKLNTLELAPLLSPAEGGPVVTAPPTHVAVQRERGFFAWLGRNRFLLVTLVVAGVIGGVVAARLDPFGSGSSAHAAKEPAEDVPLDTERLAALTRIAQQDPTAAAYASRELAELYFVAGKWQLAVDWYTSLIKIDGSDGKVYSALGKAYFNLGNLVEARRVWLQGVTIAPAEPTLHYDLAYLNLALCTTRLRGSRRGMAIW